MSLSRRALSVSLFFFLDFFWQPLVFLAHLRLPLVLVLAFFLPGGWERNSCGLFVFTHPLVTSAGAPPTTEGGRASQAQHARLHRWSPLGLPRSSRNLYGGAAPRCWPSATGLARSKGVPLPVPRPPARTAQGRLVGVAAVGLVLGADGGPRLLATGSAGRPRASA